MGTSEAAGRLAGLVRELREQALLTQEQLAQRAGLSVGTVRGLEKGRVRRPRRESVRLLVDALGLTGQDREALAAAARDELGEPATARVELVERRGQLADLDRAVGDAGAGRGALVLVTGEAGAGKTTLVRQFAAGTALAGAAGGGAGTRWLWGVCDELLTPRPLGPFRDMVAGLQAGDPTFDALIATLERPPHPAVAVVEDAHWADDATLDAIRFLGRRVGRMPALLVVTYRDDEVSADHPLRRTLGTVPPDDIWRVHLPPLSRAGVAELAEVAGRGAAAAASVTDLYRLTGGNPFYLTQVLAAPEATVPHTVQDAVMARVGRLDEAARRCVQFASVVPGRVERWVLDTCGVGAGLEEATRSGVVQTGDAVASFRHELARRAVEQSLTPARRAGLHRQVLAALAARDGDPARLAHHATLADDAAAVARYAPLAARKAASLDSHREAAAHFGQALEHAEHYPPAERAALCYEYAMASYLIGRYRQAEDAVRNAIETGEQLGDPGRVSGGWSLLSDILWFRGRGADANRAAARAIAVLEQHPPTAALAHAYAQYAKLAIVDDRADEAVRYGERAIALARELGATAVLVHAMNTVGMVRWRTPPYDNQLVRESLDTARAAGLAAHAGRGYANLAAGHLQHLEYRQAGPVLADGLAFCEAHNQIAIYHWLLALRAQWHLDQGLWEEAGADAERVIAADPEQVPARLVLGMLQARTGAEPAAATLAEAERLADRSGNAQRLTMAGLARLEHAWLQRTLEREAALVDRVWELARRSGLCWLAEAALWRQRIGGGTATVDSADAEVPAGAAEPYALQLRGCWREAAAAWAARGAPYAQADALAGAPEPEPLREALAILDRLGARPRAAMVRQRLAELG